MSGSTDAPIKGFVEIIRKNQIRGWAYCPDDPAAQVRISIEREGDSIGEGAASIFRQDLADSGIGAGHHGFVINLGASLQDETFSEIEVFAQMDGGRRTQLQLAETKASTAQAPSPKSRAQLTLNPVDAAHAPVFVLGAARSGTSGIAQALLNCGHYEGEQEGFVLPLLIDLIRAIHTHYERTGDEANWDTAISRVPKQFFLGNVRAVFVELAQQLYPSGIWVDKTPAIEMVRLAPILLEIWPRSRFIFMRRRAIENVASRRRKFPQVDFKDHCIDWAGVMSAWLDVREKLGSAFLELDQVSVARSPIETGRAVSEFLNIPETAAIRFNQDLEFNQPERTSDIFARVYDLADINWSPDEKAELYSVCGSLMERFGYSFDNTYFSYT